MQSNAATTPTDIRAANAALNAEEYRLRKVHLSSRPTMLYVELTQNCNLTCAMCRSAGTYDSSKNMPDEFFARLIDELAPTATWIDLRGWGESTILPSFTGKLRQTATSGVRVRLVTNGLLITEEQFELIFGTAGAVAVSIDAATPALAGQLGRGDLRRVLVNARLGCDVAHRLGKGELYIHTVASTFNLHELPALVDLARSLGVSRMTVSPIKTWKGHGADLANSPVETRHQLSLAVARAATAGVTVQLEAALQQDDVVAEALPTVCASPWSHALISYAGELIFCDHLVNKSEYSMGSLMTHPFEAVWNGPTFQGLRRAHVEAEASRDVGRAYTKCNWCYANRYMDSEPAPISSEMIREVSNRAAGARRLL